MLSKRWFAGLADLAVVLAVNVAGIAATGSPASAAPTIDCTGNPSGNYPDQTELEVYWSCSHGLAIGPRPCPSILHWMQAPYEVEGEGHCEWPHIAGASRDHDSSVTIDAHPERIIGNRIAYTVTTSKVSGEGNVNLVVRLDIPAGLTWVSGTNCTDRPAPQPIPYSAVPGMVCFLQADQSGEFVLAITDPLRIGAFRVRAHMTKSTPYDDNYSNNSDSATCEAVTVEIVLTCG
jgi:hypothetical protein